MRDIRSWGSAAVVYGCVIAFLLFTLPSKAQGQGSLDTLTINPEGEIRLGSIEIHPGLSYEITSDDNIFKERTKTVSDVIHKITPSLGICLPFPCPRRRHVLNLYAETEVFRFANRNAEDHTDFLVRGDFRTAPGRRLGAKGAFSFDSTEDPSSSETQSTTGPRTPRNQTDLSGSVEYSISPKTRMSLGGGYTRNRYERAANDRLSNDEGGVTLEGFYDIAAKTAILISYQVSVSHFVNRTSTDANDDSLTNRVLAGVEFDPTAKLSGRASAGFSTRSFDAAGRGSESQLSVGTNLTWRALARTTLGVAADREFADTSTVGEFAINRATVTGSVKQVITDKIGADAQFKWVQDDFVSSAREEITLTFNAGASYQFLRWFRVGIKYKYERKDSTVSANEYNLNQLVFSFMVNL